MKKIIIGVTILALCACVAGCGKKNGGNTSNESVRPIAEELRMKKNDSIKADIYIDGTYSMGGYVNFPHNTIFIDSVKKIDSVINGTWENASVKYIKFGDRNIELSRENFLNLSNKTFYQDVETSLNKVIDSTKEGKLNIIVTDLFQTNQDIESLQIALKRKCFSDTSKAIAVIGLKGQFNGEIYDIGRNQKAVKYNSGSDPNSFRPFYLLVTGDEIDVRVFVDRYIKNSNDCRVAFFCKNIGNPSILTSDGNIRKAEDKGTAPLAINGKVNGWPNYRMKVSEGKSRAYMTLTSGNIINKVPDKFDSTYMNVETQNTNNSSSGILGKIKKLFRSEKSNVTEYRRLEGVDPLRLISLKPIEESVNGNKVKKNLQLTLDPNAINKKTGKYRVSINLTAEHESYKKSNRVFDDWNFEDNKVLTGDVLKDIGKKTQNVNKFTDLLSDMSYEINKPGFNNLYIYIDAK